MLLTDIKDLIFFPFYAIFIFIVSIVINNYINKDRPYLKKIFMWGIGMRIVGSIAFAYVHTYFYGGDSYNYFINGSRHIWDAFLDNPGLAFKILLVDPQESYLYPDIHNYTSRILLWTGSPLVIKLSAFIGFFTFHTYTTNALIFSLICFSGLWKMYITILSYYPSLYKVLGYSIFLFPSLIFWGSGVMKDPLTMGALGWAFFAWDSLFIKRKKMFSSFIILLISFWIIINFKTYIFVCFIPVALLWSIYNFSDRIKDKLLKAMFKPLLIIISVASSILALNIYSKYEENYGIDNLSKQAAISYNYIKIMSGATGSAYDIGVQDGSIEALIKVLPAAINVALFRPYLWEAKNLFMFISSLESLYFLIITIQLIYGLGIKNIFAEISANVLLIFLILFTLLFAFGTGASSGNFGTLVRYKIPLIPFFLAFLFILNRSLIIKKAQMGK
jgi:hypothetical protein